MLTNSCSSTIATILIFTSLIAFLFLTPHYSSHVIATHQPSHITNTEESSMTDTNTTDIKAMQTEQLGAEYQSLKHASSHFTEGGQWNDLVDPSDSRKFQLMDELRVRVGKPGTKVDQLLNAMGDADQITRDLNNPFQAPSFMPGPVIPGDNSTTVLSTEQPDKMYFVYYWRGQHDYLWFQMDETTEEIADCQWHNDLE